MPRISAGLLMFRRASDTPEVLLVHPGGPFWKNKDTGAWSIPKGEIEPGEDLLAAAQREFKEELGFDPTGPYTPLTPIKQKAGKIVHAWAFKGNCNPETCKSNTIQIPWPPGSGKWITIPEVDQVHFFDLKTARTKINSAQAAFVEELERKLGSGAL
jgi:predicted NUDIX family NTP pyrophosphohydrolase